jgi:hypothetical protein
MPLDDDDDDDRESSVGIAAGCRLGGRGSIPDRAKRVFSTSRRHYPPWGPVGTGGSFLESKVNRKSN